MSISRRRFVTDASALGLLTALLPELAAAQAAAPAGSAEDTPHDSYDFWNGFFDSVNPYSPELREKGGVARTEGPASRSRRRNAVSALQDRREEVALCHGHRQGRIAGS